MKSYVFPGDIDPVIAQIGAEPFLYMRTDEFSEINKESEKLLLEFINCKGGRTIIYTGSGTGAMSAVVENYVSTKKKAFVIDGGSFGQRWFRLCEYYGIDAFDFKLPFAKDIDYNELEKELNSQSPDVLLCQQHETSTGQLFDLRKISDICHAHGVSLVVDVVSSFLAEHLDMDEYGIDICVTSTQKGLNLPPGLSIVFLSSSLVDYKFARKGYYWDFESNLDNLRRGQTPFSPATQIFLQLNARLRQIKEQGGETYNRELIRHRCRIFRAECIKYGWDIPAEVPSVAITGFQTKEKTNRGIFRGLIDKYNTYIMPGSVPGFYRVSHMGLQSDEELRLLAGRICEFELL